MMQAVVQKALLKRVKLDIELPFWRIFAKRKAKAAALRSLVQKELPLFISDAYRAGVRPTIQQWAKMSPGERVVWVEVSVGAYDKRMSDLAAVLGNAYAHAAIKAPYDGGAALADYAIQEATDSMKGPVQA